MSSAVAVIAGLVVRRPSSSMLAPPADQRHGEYGPAASAIRYRAPQRAAPHRANAIRGDHRSSLSGVQVPAPR